MSLDKIGYYQASCDVWLDLGTGQPLDPQPGPTEWDAWDRAGRPEDGPLRDAIGRPCRADSDPIYAATPELARRELMNAGWRVVPRDRRQPPRAACPDHRECQL